jgi:cell wall assembly regulator SMI1
MGLPRDCPAPLRAGEYNEHRPRENTSSDMKLIWDRIHLWLGANAPEVLKSLCPGAGERKIRAAERAMGITFPEDVKACYRIHDGQKCKRGARWPPPFLYGQNWERLDDMLCAWRSMKGLVDDGTFSRWRSVPDGPIRTEWWHPAWIPLTSNSFGDAHYLDLAPAPGGDVGQIISWQNDDPGREVVANSLTDWLDDFAEELEEGLWQYSEEYGGLIDNDDPF